MSTKAKYEAAIYQLISAGLRMDDQWTPEDKREVLAAAKVLEPILARHRVRTLVAATRKVGGAS